ncbi:RNA polymerase sigma factor FliA [Limnohabitans sp. T6-20]|jgi:RNA polymerase sigma factor for flagellar operon FliA|uniref:RNA polymerase sigma factor FliA n=1 Tax=Limnohabitans sp. T6-20 TaxID=1100725 RepID=UPI000D3AC79D|nr:RNA polymerase sigma factor FliA [Limnohabitans sp. T6-20]PUE10244.1 FliA/WhiG family RNA polymerase sigma factor [Limnohabitans sp. T6-20]
MSSNVSLYEEVGNRHESLILTHMPMVKRVAVHLKARLPPFMELDELVQVGMVGLIEAARSFDPTKGFEFEHFALSRVRGAILDEVRRQSFLPRSAVAFNKNENEAVHVLAAELGRAPTQVELAQFMGKEIEEFHKERGQAKRFETFSMEVVNDEVMSMPGDSSMQPEVMVEEAEFMEAVVQAIDQLPERERMVMSLYYVEELNLKEIGEVLGVSESRVSQILSAVVKKLRQNLQIS